MGQKIAIDTNILVRFLSGDDADQFEGVLRLFSSNTVWISNTVLIETEWVLRKPLGQSKESCVRAFETLLNLENLEFEDWATFEAVIKAYKIGMDFAETMHLYTANRNQLIFHSFDQSLVKNANMLGAKAELL